MLGSGTEPLPLVARQGGSWEGRTWPPLPFHPISCCAGDSLWPYLTRRERQETPAVVPKGQPPGHRAGAGEHSPGVEDGEYWACVPSGSECCIVSELTMPDDVPQHSTYVTSVSSEIEDVLKSPLLLGSPVLYL